MMTDRRSKIRPGDLVNVVSIGRCQVNRVSKSTLAVMTKKNSNVRVPRGAATKAVIGLRTNWR